MPRKRADLVYAVRARRDTGAPARSEQSGRHVAPRPLTRASTTASAPPRARGVPLTGFYCPFVRGICSSPRAATLPRAASGARGSVQNHGVYRGITRCKSSSSARRHRPHQERAGRRRAARGAAAWAAVLRPRPSAARVAGIDKRGLLAIRSSGENVHFGAMMRARVISRRPCSNNATPPRPYCMYPRRVGLHPNGGARAPADTNDQKLAPRLSCRGAVRCAAGRAATAARPHGAAPCVGPVQAWVNPYTLVIMTSGGGGRGASHIL